MIHHSKPTIEKDDIEAVVSQMSTGMIAKGEKVKELEYSLVDYIGAKHAITTSSGKSALILAFLIIGLKQGDEVILPTYICRSVYDAIRFVGAKPIVVDIEQNYCISSKAIKENISNNTKAIIVAHIFGITAEIEKIMGIVKNNNIIVIEDIAQAIGGRIEKKKLGSIGDMSIGSMGGTKVITCGEGGFLLINNKNILKEYYKIKEIIDFRAHLSDLVASLGLNQLKKNDSFINKRLKLANRYIQIINKKQINIPIYNLSKSIFFRFPIRVKGSYNFDRLRIRMDRYNVQIRKGVDKMIHQIDSNFYCANAEKIFYETISLPVYPSLELSDIDYICEKFQKIL